MGMRVMVPSVTCARESENDDMARTIMRGNTQPVNAPDIVFIEIIAGHVSG